MNWDSEDSEFTLDLTFEKGDFSQLWNNLIFALTNTDTNTLNMMLFLFFCSSSHSLPTEMEMCNTEDSGNFREFHANDSTYRLSQISGIGFIAVLPLF